MLSRKDFLQRALQTGTVLVAGLSLPGSRPWRAETTSHPAVNAQLREFETAAGSVHDFGTEQVYADLCEGFFRPGMDLADFVRGTPGVLPAEPRAGAVEYTAAEIRTVAFRQDAQLALIQSLQSMIQSETIGPWFGDSDLPAQQRARIAEIGTAIDRVEAHRRLNGEVVSEAAGVFAPERRRLLLMLRGKPAPPTDGPQDSGPRSFYFIQSAPGAKPGSAMAGSPMNTFFDMRLRSLYERAVWRAHHTRSTLTATLQTVLQPPESITLSAGGEIRSGEKPFALRAHAALLAVEHGLHHLRHITRASSCGIYTVSQRQQLQIEVSALIQTLRDVGDVSAVNGGSLFPPAGQRTYRSAARTYTLPAVDPTDLRLARPDGSVISVSSAGMAQFAFTTVDAAVRKIAVHRRQLLEEIGRHENQD